jgi:hypothetical protein
VVLLQFRLVSQSLDLRADLPLKPFKESFYPLILLRVHLDHPLGEEGEKIVDDIRGLRWRRNKLATGYPDFMWDEF